MTAVTIEQFDRMERRTDRTLAFVLWGKHVKNAILCFAMLVILGRVLRGLIASLSPGQMESLSEEQALELTKKLQELHGQLLLLVRCAEASRFLGKSQIRTIEESTEDLGEIIEDLVLSGNPQFRDLLAKSVRSLSSVESAGLVGHLQD